MISDSDKRFLLQVARQSIESVVKGVTLRTIEPHSNALDKPCGAFVTLHKQGELRGCIGYAEGIKPLVETVQDAATKAAIEDPRFPAITQDELSLIEIEISVLSPMKPVKNFDEIEIGKHGLIIEQHHTRGLLLPQVPVEYGWDVKTYLKQVARKAGLRPSALNDPATKFFSFTAEIFSERSLKLSAQ